MEYEKNPDGSYKLDNEGNKIPVTTPNNGPEVDPEKAGMIEEIKDLRLKNGIANALLQEKKESETPATPAVETDEDKIAKVVASVLSQRDNASAESNKKSAFDRFIADNKEFDPENDQLGLKRQALERKFNQFNTNGLTSVDDFLSVIGDAKRLLVGNDSQQQTFGNSQQFSASPTPRNMPPAKVDNDLSPKELKLMETTGKTKDQILSLKAKNPEYFEQLLDFVRVD